MARPPTHKVALTLPRRLIARAKRAARSQDLALDQFLRHCIEGRINQIEASRRPRRRRR